jgi:hypothetical protein
VFLEVCTTEATILALVVFIALRQKKVGVKDIALGLVVDISELFVQ